MNEPLEWQVRQSVGAPRLLFIYGNQLYDLSRPPLVIPRPERDVVVALMSYAIETLEGMESDHDY